MYVIERKTKKVFTESMCVHSHPHRIFNHSHTISVCCMLQSSLVFHSYSAWFTYMCKMDPWISQVRLTNILTTMHNIATRHWLSIQEIEKKEIARLVLFTLQLCYYQIACFMTSEDMILQLLSFMLSNNTLLWSAAQLLVFKHQPFQTHTKPTTACGWVSKSLIPWQCISHTTIEHNPWPRKCTNKLCKIKDPLWTTDTSMPFLPWHWGAD